MNKYIRLFDTVKYLKVKQIYFRIFYFARNRFRNKVGFKYPTFENIKINKLSFQTSINAYTSYNKPDSFSFLNLEKSFEGKIDWNYSNYGKLWTYNLTYFDYLNQDNIHKDEAIKLIKDFVKNDAILKDAYEPFPISLRGINWVKYLSLNNINESGINNSLYKQYQILLDNLEYHLLGNHLLENGFSLLFAGFYFQDEKFYQKAKDILIFELNEQILDDGSHFELSPMYHQIMLFRVLDCINLVKNNSYKNEEILEFLISKAEVMLSWLENITYNNGSIPLLNDSTNKIAPTSNELFDYAKRLKLKMKKLELSNSGYRKVSKENYECIVDIGDIGPDYIPGHAHADTFNFELNINKKPFIVDTGLSTYETNERRTCERSTYSHNTVTIDNMSSSQVWAGFRVANRAKIVEVEEKIDYIKASHDGFKDIIHTRVWEFKDSIIIIKDDLSKQSKAIAMLHFHPSITKEEILSKIKTDNEINFVEYFYSPEFNTRIKAIALEIKFNKNLKIEINI